MPRVNYPDYYGGQYARRATRGLPSLTLSCRRERLPAGDSAPDDERRVSAGMKVVNVPCITSGQGVVGQRATAVVRRYSGTSEWVHEHKERTRRSEQATARTQRTETT